MTTLNSLHTGLARVKRFRTSVRIGSALAVFVSIVLWVLIVAFALDVMAKMGFVERFIVLVLFGVATVWAFSKYIVPAFATREDELALALMVERQQGIGSELVAALQFADTKRPQYGSSDLRNAVVEYTDEASGHLDYLEGFSRKQLNRRAGVALGTIVIVVLICVGWPAHARVFADRLLLGKSHYPTRTVIDAVESPADNRAAYGQPVEFRVRLSGEMPGEDDVREVRLRAMGSGVSSTIELKPVANGANVYSGTLSRALDDMRYSIHVGDAYTEPAKLELIPLPIVEVVLDVETPDYARGLFDPGDANRGRIALEGSRVVPLVSADKKLNAATITIDKQTYPMTRKHDLFVLEGTDSPLARVTGPVRYEVQVVDADGLSLERPISGLLQVRADQPPRIAAATVTRVVLPDAAPQVKYRAVDDFAIDRVVVHKTVYRQARGAALPSESFESSSNVDATAGDAPATTQTITQVIAQPGDRPRELPGVVSVDLSDLKLEVGDSVGVTFEVFDDRGGMESKSGRSERLVFAVTDRAGVLAALRELDAQMDEKLDQIINAQLGSGDSP
jgi:hypothetical protein